MAITGDFVNGLHLMVGNNSDMDNGSPKVTATSENTFFLNWESGKVYVFSGGEWNEAGSGVAQFIAALLGGGSSLPVVDSDDAGKVLTVSNDGVWEPEEAGAASVTAEAVASAIGDMSAAQVASVISDLSVQAIPTTETVTGATPTITAEDNHVYSCGEITSLTITDSAQNISFKVDFVSGSTATVINTPSGYKAPGGDLTAEANKEYELDVRNGKAVLTAFEAVSAS